MDNSVDWDKFRLELEDEARNGTKINTEDWKLIKSRYEWYKKQYVAGKKMSLFECRIYALLDCGYDPRNKDGDLIGDKLSS